MSTDYVRSQYRLPTDLHERLQAASAASGRSMNAELVARLEASFGPDILAEIREMFHEIKASIDAK